MMHYEYFEHTADIGIRGYGATFPEALEAAARGMMDQICDSSRMTVTTEKIVTIQEASREECVVRFLNQLIYLLETAKFLPLNYQLTQAGDSVIKAVLRGDSFNFQRDEFIQEIKAATYHQLLVQQDEKGWMIQVIVDI